MKKVFITLSLFAALVACNSNDANQAESTNDAAAGKGSPVVQTPDATAANDLSSNPDYQAGLSLEAKNDCATCHKLDDKLVGPSFREIANKYPNDQATIEMLGQKIIQGGAGNWGQIPMTPHPQMSKEDAESIVKYILLLKK